MSRGAIVTGDQLTADVDLRPDVCVVGSGAGGAVVAEGLVARGRSVVMLEEGGYHTQSEFDMQEGTAYPKLYQELGSRATADLAIIILQGRAVGGTTVVNWTSCFRTPERILRHWESVHRVTGLTPDVLRPHFEAVEQRLSIAPWPIEQVNRNNRILLDGAAKLGISTGLIARNVKGCFNSGYCGMGCPVDAKQAMHLTYIPDAVENGLTVYANCRADRVETAGPRAAAVHATVLDPATDRPSGRRVVVRPKVVVVACGAINTPVLLLKSGIDPNRRTGKRTWLHPVATTAALFDEPVEAFYGAPQSVYSHQFWDRGPGKIGFFIETPPIHPMLASTAFGGFGSGHRDLLAKLAYTNALIAPTVDGLLPIEEGATVTVRSDGRPRVDYALTEENWEAFREANKITARIQFAAGAREVFTLHGDPVRLTSEADVALIDRAPWEPLRVALFTAHVMGGAPMGRDPARAVVDSRLKHHGLNNLYVVDGSVFPTSLGVNPSETIYAIAHWSAEHIAVAAA